MLVLSRRETDRILFPSLGISVEVLRVQGNRTKIGIDAPADVPIIRHEIADLKGIEFAPGKESNDQRLKSLVYAIRTRLDSAAMNLNRLHSSLDPHTDLSTSTQPIIEELFGELQELEREAHGVLEDAGLPVNATPQALLVEDSPAERTLLEAYLDLCGFAVTTAEDGQDALDYLSMHARPDVVLLDMQMPRIDGPSFVRKVRSDQRLRVFRSSH